MFCMFAQIFRAQQIGAHRIKLVVERLCFRQYCSASSALRYQAATCFDQNGLLAFAQERRGAMAESPVQQVNQSTRNETRAKYPNDVQGSDGYQETTDEGKIKRVAPLLSLRS